MKVIKRNGVEVDFSRDKIFQAITKANDEVRSFDEKDATSEAVINTIATRLYERCRKRSRATSVEEIQDMIETELMKEHAYETAKRYIRYRYWRSQVRQRNTTDDQILALIENDNEEVKQENSNKNPTVVSVQRDYMAGEVSKDLTKRFLLPEDVMRAHEEGLIHFHDADYFAQHMSNCCLVNLADMLENGTVISGTKIEKPHSFSTACNIATQIIAQVASSQYGGQSISLTHLAPFVDVSRQKIRSEVKEELTQLRNYDDSTDYQTKVDAAVEDIVERRVREEIKRGVQTIQYQVVTLMTTNGQAPFITVFMYLGEAKDEQTKKDLALIIEEVLRQRWQGVKNEAGAWVTPAFPKLIYVLEEQNIHPDSEYYYLTKLSAMCTAKRMVPDYISEKIMLQNKVDSNGEGHCYPCMGCRSFLTPYVDENGNPKYYGRFNGGVVTVNLVDIGLSAGHNMKKFWELFEERMELCHKALQYRHERLTGTKSDVAPILWQYGALTRLKKGETIDKYLHGGYSTLSLGYAGLWECVYALNGKKLTEPEGEALGLTIMKKLNEYTAKWKQAENIDYSLYGTPLESTTYKFAKCLQKKFGTVKGVTDKNYITNSYHVHVTEPIDAFEKLALEAKFQALSPGGAISYVEVPNMQDNIEAVLEIMRFIYDHIMYAELNTKSDYCQECGYDGEIQIVENEDKKLIWRCPNCGNTDQTKMNVARRTCGKNTVNIATVQNDRNSRKTLKGNLEPSSITLKNNNYKTCDICGRHDKHIIAYYGQKLCNKHYRQIKKHGRIIDTSPRTIYDKNKIIICEDIAYIELYDNQFNVIAKAIIDAEDVGRVKYSKWRLNANGYVISTAKRSGRNTFLHRRIMNTNDFVDHINHNPLDNRKQNLRIVSKSQNQMNVNYKGVSPTKNGKHYAHIKINHKMINLGVYDDEAEALYARWKAECLLFKEFRFPKDKPQILARRENEINNYVIEKVQRL